MGKNDNVDVSGFGMQGAVPFLETADKNEQKLHAEVEAKNPTREEDEDDDEDSPRGRGGSDSRDDEEFDGGEEEEDRDDLDASEEDSGEDEDEEEDDFEEDEEEVEDDDEEEPEVKAKSYKITLPDGTQLDATDDGTIKIKENGKFTRVKLRDLIQDRNGRIKNDELIRRKSEEVNRLQSTVSTLSRREESTTDLVKSFSDGITKGNVVKAMGVIGELSGVEQDKIPDFIMESLSGMMKGIQTLATKDEDQITREAEAYKTESELNRLKRERDGLKSAKSKEAAVAAKKEMAKSLNIQEADMNAAFHALVERNQELEKAGYEPETITMQSVGDLVVDSIVDEGFKAVAAANDLELSTEDRGRLIKLGRIERERRGHKDLSKKDYVRLLSNYANKELKGLSRNLGEDEVERPRKSNPKRQKRQSSRKKGKLKEITRVSQAWPI